jgi:hypothetical protein
MQKTSNIFLIISNCNIEKVYVFEHILFKN